MNYRKVTLDDLPAIILMGRGFWEQTSYHKAGMLYSPERATMFATLAIKDGISVIAEEEGKIYGMMICLVSPALFSDDLLCSDLAFYVSPTGRGLGVGRALLSCVRQEAEERGIKAIAMMSLQSVHPAASEALFRSEAYHHTQSTYLLVLK
jgi:GNAT superfamily N-acetyltransferase